MHCQGTACTRQVDMGLTSAEIQFVVFYSLSCQLFSYTKDLCISNCDICAEQKISFMNEMK
jgi:hypothetical protein